MKQKPSGDDRDLMTAVAFAEVGEWDTARKLLPRPAPGRLRAWLERHLVAAALAEEGLQEEAVRTARALAPPAPARAADFIDTLLAARGVRMLCGVAPAAALAARH